MVRILPIDLRHEEDLASQNKRREEDLFGLVFMLLLGCRFVLSLRNVKKQT
jgi:hypothetical protein